MHSTEEGAVGHELERLRETLEKRKDQFENLGQDAEFAIKNLEASLSDLKEAISLVCEWVMQEISAARDDYLDDIRKFYKQEATRLRKEVEDLEDFISSISQGDQGDEFTPSDTIQDLINREKRYLEDISNKLAEYQHFAEHPDLAERSGIDILDAFSEGVSKVCQEFKSIDIAQSGDLRDVSSWHRIAEKWYPKVIAGAPYTGPAIATVNPIAAGVVVGLSTAAGLLDAFKEEIRFAPSNLLEGIYRKKIIQVYERLLKGLDELIQNVQEANTA